MTIEWKRHALAALASAALFVPSPAPADVLSEMNRFWQGAAVNTTGPTAFQGQASGHWTLGNLYLRAPVRSEQIASVSLPSFRAGCGGIDAFAGAFSFINSDQLIAFGRAVAQNAAGFAFELALETISPVIAETMAKLRALAQWVNSQNLNSCETAQALVGALWSKNDRASACHLRRDRHRPGDIQQTMPPPSMAAARTDAGTRRSPAPRARWPTRCRSTSTTPGRR